MVKWYLPTFYGDIQLESKDLQHTRVTFEKLTPEEMLAMRALLTHAAQKGWATAELCESTAQSLPSLAIQPAAELAAKPKEIWLNAKLAAVQRVLSKPLKPGRKLLSVVRFADGAIEEITTANIAQVEAATASEHPKPEESKTKQKNTKPAVAATVAAPVIGCPAPDFERAELRATAVLEAFLTPVQLADFRSQQAFIAHGADSGDAYAVISRHAPSTFTESRRSLFNLTKGFPLCVHDWAVPAAEEMLALFLMVSLPGRESFVSLMPDDGFEHAELFLGADDDWPDTTNRVVACRHVGEGGV